MTPQEVIDLIKTRGYWRIHFEPLDYVEKLTPLRTCKEIVQRNSVSLRGWNYPHIPGRNDEKTGMASGSNYYEGWLDWEGRHHKEFWRMYQSGQFIHYKGLVEDWHQNYEVRNMWEREDFVAQPGEVLGVISATYLITEIFEFLSRLQAEELYNSGVKVTIGLHNTSGRKLVIEEFSRVPLSYDRTTSASEIVFTQEFEAEELISNPSDLACNVIVYLFERFGWDPPNVEVIKKDQLNLLERRR